MTRIRIQPGPPGPRGEPFNVDATGPKASRPAFVADVAPFSYLADDTGEISIKRAAEWGPWIPFRGQDGSQGPPGQDGAPGADGQDGSQGPPGDPGPDAFEVWKARENQPAATFAEYLEDIRGADGRTIYTLPIGNEPDASLGVDGDYAMDLAGNNNIIYGPKTNGVWPIPGKNLRGAIGFDGDPGPQGLPGIQGPQGDPGQSYSPDAQGTLAERTAYDAYAPPFVYHVLDETLPEHDQFFYKLPAAGAWSEPFPRATPGPQGPPGEQGVPGQQGPPGKTLYSGTGAPSATLGAAGDHYMEKAPSGEAVTVYGPKTADGWGAGFPLGPKPLKLAYLAFGGGGNSSGTAGLAPRTDLTSFHVRNVFRFPVGVKRFRLKTRNIDLRSGAVAAGAITVNGGYLGLHAPDANGDWTGSFPAAPTQIFGASGLAADGAEWQSGWIHPSTFGIQAHKEYVLSIGYTAPAGQTVYVGSNRAYVGSTAANASAQANPISGFSNQPFTTVMEYEFEGSNPVLMVIGDSISEGTSTRLGQRHNWLTQHAISAGAAAICAGIGGSQASEWASPGYRFSRFDYANAAFSLDAVYILLGRNDFSAGRTGANVTADLQATINFVRANLKPKRIYLGTILPTATTGWTAQHETYRQNVNAWIRSLPSGVVSVIDFDKALSDATRTVTGLGTTGRGEWSSATAYAVNDLVWYRYGYWRATAAGTNFPPINNLDKWQQVFQIPAEYDIDGIHPSEAGQARMASLLPHVAA